ncbi:MAG: MFS transporter [Myxococcota bacterium]
MRRPFRPAPWATEPRGPVDSRSRVATLARRLGGLVRRASYATIHLTVFLDLMGFGIILPHLPYAAERFGASGVGVGALLTSYSVAQLLAAPVLGRVSDRFGRRPVLLLALTGSTLSLVLTGLAGTLAILLAARALAGIFAGSISTAQAAIADVTEPEDRAKAMGLLGASIGLGFVMGPAIGAALAPMGFAFTCFAAAGLTAADLIMAAFVLPETRTAEARSAARPTLPLAEAARRPVLRPLLLSLFLGTFAFVGLEAIFPLLGEHRFGLFERDMGLVFAYIGVVIIVIQGGVVGRLTRRLGERRVVVVGGGLMAVGFAAIAFSEALAFTMVALGVLSAGQGLLRPALSALVSMNAHADEQGAVLGLGQSLGAGARALGPLVAGWLWDRQQGAPFVLGAVLTLAVVLVMRTARTPRESGRR